MEKVTKINIQIDGLYAWGKGYLSDEIRVAWRSYWADRVGEVHNGWHYGRVDDTPCLYNLFASLYVHPMEITGLIKMDCGEKDLELLKKTVEEVLAFMKEKVGVDATYDFGYKVIELPSNGAWNKF